LCLDFAAGSALNLTGDSFQKPILQPENAAWKWQTWHASDMDPEHHSLMHYPIVVYPPQATNHHPPKGAWLLNAEMFVWIDWSCGQNSENVQPKVLALQSSISTLPHASDYIEHRLANGHKWLTQVSLIFGHSIQVVKNRLK